MTLAQPVTPAQRPANCRKVKGRLAKLHARIAAIRSDALHKLTTDLTCRVHTIGIEDLSARHAAQPVFGTLHRRTG
ncbi:transposase [Verminephrobacter aporrectodeae]|uniref:transposase n=1 Tax=Verminephrobacter aporrectodeae TaxID=1110389 RepID=UPI0022388DD6|nr:transposase [Verminephrobacter aporrectodeae]